MNTNNPTDPTSGRGARSGWFDDFAALSDAQTEPASDRVDEEPVDDAQALSPREQTFIPADSDAMQPPVGPGEADTDIFAAIDPDNISGSGWDWITPEPIPDAVAPAVGEWGTTADGPNPEAAPGLSAHADVFPLSAGDAGPPPRRRRRMRGYVIAAGLLVLVVAMAAVGALTAFSDGNDSPTPAPTSTAVAAPPAAATPADADCPNRTDGLVTTGRDAGGTTSGPAAIKAFEYAYYVRRSGPAAREVVAPLARVPSAEEIDTGIKTAVAVGTGHCLKITDRNDGLWGVELTVLPPGGTEPSVLHQLIQTAVIDGRTLITAITKDTTQ